MDLHAADVATENAVWAATTQDHRWWFARRALAHFTISIARRGLATHRSAAPARGPRPEETTMAADSPSAGSFLPGLDMLQDMLAKAGASVPGLGPWAAPTLDPQELTKRIEELRTVQFWLENNARLIATTIQSLEVQRMTLTALKSMNVQMGDLAAAFRAPTPSTASAGTDTAAAATPPAAPHPPTAATPRRAARKGAADSGQASTPPTPVPPGVVDPMQWWNTLTQQFGQIAAQALKEGRPSAAAASAPPAAASSGDPAGAAPAPAAPAKTGTARRPARKTTARR
jgi:hypothetical protein